MEERGGDFLAPATTGSALADALTLKYLDGGGDGCMYPDEKPSFARRRFHHLTFYGFLLCFAATSVATIYHYAFGWKAPYPFWSLPVLLGTAGGIGLLVGPAGLLWLKRRRDPELADPEQKGMEAGFLALLDLFTMAAVTAGVLFFLAGVVGLLRFPDALTRLHALTKADNVGLGLIVAGLLPQAGSVLAALKLLLVWLAVLLAGATMGQLIARVARRARPRA
jgi:monovalent cation/proton antiporter MnhG/PhaG subunit